MHLHKLYRMRHKERKKENTEKKIRDLDNTMWRRSNMHLIRLSGGKETEKWAEAINEKNNRYNHSGTVER